MIVDLETAGRPQEDNGGLPASINSLQPVFEASCGGPSCAFWWICSRGALVLAFVVIVKRVRNGWALVPVCGWVRKQSRARLSFDSVAFDMATALQIAIAQGLDINDIEGGAAKVAALAAEAEREAMVLKAKVRV